MNEREIEALNAAADEEERVRLDDADVFRLATVHRLEAYEVSMIIRCFRNVDSKKSGTLTRTQFCCALGKVLDSGVPEALLESAWKAVTKVEDEDEEDLEEDEEETVEWEPAMDAFCGWYMANLFGQVAFAIQSPSEALVNAVVEAHDVLPTTAEKLKVAFDQFDTDGSGRIDFEEFRSMLAVLLGIADEKDLARDRVNRFWKEIDNDSNGVVDFLEFCAWYLKYFSPEVEATRSSIDVEGPFGKFYSTYDPRIQRAKSRIEAVSCEF
jgi:Ca2+-binding EF-hand superfamily protein